MVAKLISDNLIPILFLSSLFLFSTCHKKTNEPIEPEQFANIYVELVNVALDSTLADSTRQKETVLSKFDISEQKFRETIEYYHSHPQLWLDVFTKVEEKLEEKKQTKK